MPLTIFELPFVNNTVGLLVLSKASDLVFIKLAFVDIIVCECEIAIAMTLVFLPFTIVVVTISIPHLSVARFFVLSKKAYVRLAVRVRLVTLSVLLEVKPLAFVGISVTLDNLRETIKLS